MKSRDWNDVTLALAGDVLTLSLNGIDVYEAPLPPDDERFFGLYHDKSRTAAQVRNVVLSGKWPQRISADDLADPTRPTKPDNDALRRLKHALIGEDLLSQQAPKVLHAMDVNLAIHIPNGMIDKLMYVFVRQPRVGLQGIIAVCLWLAWVFSFPLSYCTDINSVCKGTVPTNPGNNRGS